MMDAKNTFLQHLLVAILSLGLAFVFQTQGIGWSTAFARTSFVLLFLTLFIGPFVKLKEPKTVSNPLKSPWYWRSELGIWFTITGLIHFYFVMGGRPKWSIVKVLGGFTGGGGYGLANLLGLIALVLSLILAATSFGKVIRYLGVETWKWLHSFTYVVFYLVATHFIYFQFFSTYGGGPDWFGYLGIVMTILIILLQFSAFVKAVRERQKA